MTPEAIELITEWWIDCLRWGMIISALPMAAFLAVTVVQSVNEMRQRSKRGRAAISRRWEASHNQKDG